MSTLSPDCTPAHRPTRLATPSLMASRSPSWGLQSGGRSDFNIFQQGQLAIVDDRPVVQPEGVVDYPCAGVSVAAPDVEVHARARAVANESRHVGSVWVQAAVPGIQVVGLLAPALLIRSKRLLIFFCLASALHPDHPVVLENDSGRRLDRNGRHRLVVDSDNAFHVRNPDGAMHADGKGNRERRTL